MYILLFFFIVIATIFALKVFYKNGNLEVVDSLNPEFDQKFITPENNIYKNHPAGVQNRFNNDFLQSGEANNGSNDRLLPKK